MCLPAAGGAQGGPEELCSSAPRVFFRAPFAPPERPRQRPGRGAPPPASLCGRGRPPLRDLCVRNKKPIYGLSISPSTVHCLLSTEQASPPYTLAAPLYVLRGEKDFPVRPRRLCGSARRMCQIFTAFLGNPRCLRRFRWLILILGVPLSWRTGSPGLLHPSIPLSVSLTISSTGAVCAPDRHP